MIRYIYQKLMSPRPLCETGTGSILYEGSRIVNIQNNRKQITLGSNSHIKGELLVFAHGGQIDIGNYCYVGENTRIWSAKKIFIGNRVLISHNCNIFDNDTHPLDPELRHKQFKDIITVGHPLNIDLKEEDIIIEDDVLIGANSIILKGVTLGNACIVGAGSVVTKDVLPYTVVAGNPAKVIKNLRSPSSMSR
jgi:acetyltransferase-like isoleucine patch superfamily enzyme